eukprot:SAG31_NODE_19865_length_589_cov_14.214286_1_plen_93_part_01
MTHRISIRAPRYRGSPIQLARALMVLVLVVLVVPAPPLVQTGCSVGWGGMSPGPSRRPAQSGHRTAGPKVPADPHVTADKSARWKYIHKYYQP